MADEDRPSVDIIANVRAASAIAMAEEKRAKGKTTGKVSKKEAKDAKVKFDPTSTPLILPITKFKTKGTTNLHFCRVILIYRFMSQLVTIAFAFF